MNDTMRWCCCCRRQLIVAIKIIKSCCRFTNGMRSPMLKCKIMLLSSQLVNYCYYNNRIVVPLLPLACTCMHLPTLIWCCRRRSRLIVAIIIIEFRCHSQHLHALADVDTARWCCCCHCQLIVDIIILIEFFCRCHCLHVLADTDTARWCCCRRSWLIVDIIIIEFDCRCHCLHVLSNADTARWLLLSPPVDCFYYTNRIFLPITTCMHLPMLIWCCLSWHPVDCCIYSIKCWCHCHRLHALADADTARWCCCCRIRLIVAIRIIKLFCRCHHLHVLADTDTARWCCCRHSRMIVAVFILEFCCRHHLLACAALTLSDTARWCCCRCHCYQLIVSFYILIRRRNIPRSCCKNHHEFLLPTCCWTCCRRNAIAMPLPIHCSSPKNLMLEPSK